MTTTNSTGNEEQTSFDDVPCSAVFKKENYSQLIFLTAVHSILSITAFLGNTLILVALHKESSLHPPSKLLFRNLATTDLCVGIIVQPLYVSYLQSLVSEGWNICRTVFAANHITAYILCSVSLLTLTTISVDKTSRPVARAQIKTSCNFQANVSNAIYLFLGLYLVAVFSQLNASIITTLYSLAMLILNYYNKLFVCFEVA